MIVAILNVLFAATPAGAQEVRFDVVSNYPPLSPEEAINVLRSSHSPLDVANRPTDSRIGPIVYVLAYDRSVDGTPPMAPSAPLSQPYAYPPPFWPYDPYAFGRLVSVNPWTMIAPRGHSVHRHDVERAPVDQPAVSAPPRVEPPPVVMPPMASAGVVRR
jgi:hypothetical protein